MSSYPCNPINLAHMAGHPVQAENELPPDTPSRPRRLAKILGVASAALVLAVVAYGLVLFSSA